MLDVQAAVVGLPLFLDPLYSEVSLGVGSTADLTKLLRCSVRLSWMPTM